MVNVFNAKRNRKSVTYSVLNKKQSDQHHIAIAHSAKPSYIVLFVFLLYLSGSSDISKGCVKIFMDFANFYQ